MLAILATLIYVITGAPFSGKTSIIEELDKLHEITCREAALDILLEAEKEGIDSPWADPTVQLRIFLEQHKRELQALRRAKQMKKKRVFVDRGLLDDLAYIEHSKLQCTPQAKLINGILQDIGSDNRYAGIFYVMPHGHKVIPVHGHHEEIEEALIIGERIRKVYQDRGYRMEYVPDLMPPSERAEYILKKIFKKKVLLK